MREFSDYMGVCQDYRDLGSGLLRPVESPVPKCEGPGAPSSVVYKTCRTGATRRRTIPTFDYWGGGGVGSARSATLGSVVVEVGLESRTLISGKGLPARS